MVEARRPIGEKYAARADAWLHREDTWLARGLHRASPTTGAEYRNSRAKRAAELAVTIPAAVLAAAPAAAIYAANIFQKPFGHPFYRQMRQSGPEETVDIIKFRTMPFGCDTDLTNTSLTITAQNAPENDPRATRFGKVLRTFEADELPQLYQVLKGDLSLVDLRITTPTDINTVRNLRHDIYEQWLKNYFDGLPGLVSLNSVLNSSRKNVLKRSHLDNFYARHASLGLDLYILYRGAERMARKAEQKFRHLGGKQII